MIVPQSWKRAFFVPVLVRRPAGAPQARRPGPLMAAAGAASACGEGIPDRAAARERPFRRVRARAAPTARRRRLPAAERAADAVERLLVFGRLTRNRRPSGVDVAS